MNKYELFLYDKITKVLKWHVWTKAKQYFSDDDWYWEEWEEYEVVTDKKLKTRILKANKENIKACGWDFVYMYQDGRIVSQ